MNPHTGSIYFILIMEVEDEGRNQSQTRIPGLNPPSSHPGNSYTETQSTPSPLHHLVWVTLERVGVEDEEPEEWGWTSGRVGKEWDPKRRHVRAEGTKEDCQHPEPWPQPPLQEAQVTLEPVKTSETPGLPRTCHCESPTLLAHMIKMQFFLWKKKIRWMLYFWGE